MSIVKKHIKFDLSIDGVKVKNLDELRAHITVEIIDLLKKGILIKWLKQLNEENILGMISQINQHQDEKALFRDVIAVLGDIEIDDQIIDALFEVPIKIKPNIKDVQEHSKTHIIEIRVPDIGGYSDVNVAEVYVKVGDKIHIDDNLIMLETDKATMEVPADKAGIVTEVLVQVGSRVNEGDVFIKMREE